MKRIQKATILDLETVRNIVYTTIYQIYPHYYPQEVVDFFINHHSEDNINKSFETSDIYLLFQDDKCIATGTIETNTMTRVFVLPQYQKQGYGTQLMDFLENKISENYNKIVLDASLPAFRIYLKRGYRSVEYIEEPTLNGRFLCYHVMSKNLCKTNKHEFNLNGRTFHSVSNTNNGEVSDKTYFKYYQEGLMIWASYSGGKIKRGTLIGKFTEYNLIYFTYQHMNTDGEIRIGECRSTIARLPDSRLYMDESWKWLNGDMSTGYSTIEECID